VSVPTEPLPVGDAASADVQVARAASINRAMEALIRQCPQQYLWGYNRFKQPRALPEQRVESEAQGR
jgi:KDO2-lipid IV(A) lauroyltransferase